MVFSWIWSYFNKPVAPPKLIGTYGGVRVYQTAPDKLEWDGPAAVDGDGSGRCYHPNSAAGLDLLANAGRPGNWYGIVTDTGRPDGKPLIQGPQDPYPGFYISSTALVADSSKPESNPHRFFDAESVNYIVCPMHFPFHILGKKCVVSYKDRTDIGIVADVGGPEDICEISIAFASALGIPSSPRTGGVPAGVHYTVYL